MRKAWSLAVVAATVLTLLSLFGATAEAADQLPGQGNGLKISPVRTDLTIEKGGSREVSLFIENVTASPMTIHGVVNDFVASDDESGEPRIILDPNQSAPDHSFKTLVNSLPTLTIQPNERREVRITVAVPKDAAGGGYYGAIRFQPGESDSGKNVSLTASVGSIFLVTVPGNLVQQLKIESFDVVRTKDGIPEALFDSGPVSVVTRFKNIGNIHVAPFGKIQVKDFSGKVIQETEINNTQPRATVLPNSIRKYTTDVRAKHLFGRYTVEGSFGYGDDGSVLVAKKTFYVIPYKYIAGVVLLLAFLIFGLPRLIRAYNRSVVRRAQNTSGGQPKKPKPKPRNKPKK